MNPNEIKVSPGASNTPNPGNEKRILIVLIVLLLLSAGLAWYVSSSATHTLSI